MADVCTTGFLPFIAVALVARVCRGLNFVAPARACEAVKKAGSTTAGLICALLSQSTASCG